MYLWVCAEVFTVRMVVWYPTTYRFPETIFVEATLRYIGGGGHFGVAGRTLFIGGGGHFGVAGKTLFLLILLVTGGWAGRTLFLLILLVTGGWAGPGIITQGRDGLLIVHRE